MVNDSSAERHANTLAVLSSLRTDGDARLARLAEFTGLSRRTVDSILTELVAMGWIRQCEPEPGGRAGRPARTFRLEPDAGFVVGVDVGVNQLTAVVADITGTPRRTLGRPISRTISGERRRAAVQTLITDALAEFGVEPSDALAIGLGVPGIIDPAGRVTLSTVVADWTGFHVSKHFARWSGVSVSVGNDANLATLAEHWIGAASLVDDVVYVLAGRRTSAGILLDGRLHVGRHGAAGEIGSIPELFFDTERLLGRDDPGRAGDSADAIAAVFRAAQRGDVAAAGRVEEFYRNLARSVDFLIKAFDPDVVVLGGGISRAGRPLLDGVERRLQRSSFATTPLVLSELGPDAVALGAVRTALQSAVAHRPLLAALLARPLGHRPVDARTAAVDRDGDLRDGDLRDGDLRDGDLRDGDLRDTV